MPDRRVGPGLLHRYAKSDLRVLDREEKRRFLGAGDPQTYPDLAWELLYRLEPELYDRLVQGERPDPGILASLEEALEISAVLYPQAIVEIRRRGEGRVPYDVLGVNPPHDVAYKRRPA